MSDMVVVDELPEPIRGGREAKYVAALIEAQTEHPGKWCLILNAKRGTSYVRSFRISHEEGNAYAEVDIPNFEWATRRQVDGNEDLYARYVG